MAVESYYFSHDYSARNDPKLQKVLMRLGQAGKGVYWDLIEMLYEEGGYLSLNEIESYAFALRTDTDCITKLINDFNLFQNDGLRFWSDSVLKRLFMREEKSRKAAKSASIRWKKHKENANALETDANALQTECDSNAIKDNKEKDNKEKEEDNNTSDTFSIKPDPWGNYKSMDDLKTVLLESKIWYASYAKSAGITNPSNIPVWIERFFDHATASGKDHKTLSDAKSHCLNWTRKQIELGDLPQPANMKPKKLSAIERRNLKQEVQNG